MKLAMVIDRDVALPPEGRMSASLMDNESGVEFEHVPRRMLLDAASGLSPLKTLSMRVL
jgi:hypothetical protein